MANSQVSTGSNLQRNEISELRTILKNPEVQRDKAKYRMYVQQVIAYMTRGMDVSSLFSEMIMASVTNDLVQKKLVYLYIRVQAKSNRDVAILMISTLTKDATDDNAIVRGLALRTMCELRIHSLLDYIKAPLMNGLVDKSSYVRKIAVIGALKVFHFAPDVIKGTNVVNTLLEIVNSKDKQVMANSIFALKEMLSGEGGIPLTKDIAGNIFSMLHTLNEWTQSILISILASYQPGSHEEVIAILNSLDDRLKHPNKGIVLATSKLFLVYTNNLDSLKTDMYKRLIGPLLSVVTSSLPELSYTGLCLLLSVYRGRMHLLGGKLKAFFLRGNESPYLKKMKLSVLTEIANESSVESTLSELRYCVMDTDICVAKFATKCIGKIGTKHKSAANGCLDILLSLLDLDLDHIVACVFESIKDILTEMKDLGNSIVANIHNYWEKASDQSAKASVIWILGEFGHTIANSPYIMENIADTLEQEQSIVKLELLNASLRLFFKRPPEFQNVVGRILYQLIEDEVNMDVHDRALFYYRSLKQDVTKVSKLLNTARDLKKNKSSVEMPWNIEEVKAEDVNTLSVLLTQQV